MMYSTPDARSSILSVCVCTDCFFFFSAFLYLCVCVFVCVDAYLWFFLRMVKACGVVLTRRRCDEVFAIRISACSSSHHRIHADGGMRRKHVAYRIRVAHGGVFTRIAFGKEGAGPRNSVDVTSTYTRGNTC